MFGLFSARLTFRLGPATTTMASTATRTAILPTLSRNMLLSTLPHTRTFVSSTRLFYPTSSTKKSTASKTGAKKSTTTSKTTPKKKAAPKKKVAAKKKAPKKKKVVAKKPVKIKISEDQKPPKRPMSPWLLYLADRRAASSIGATLADNQAFTKRSAEEWKNISAVDKQVYVARFEEAKIDYKKKLHEWSQNVDNRVIIALNKQRVAKGLPKVRRSRDPDAPKKPLHPYIRFFMEWRNSYTGEASSPKDLARGAGQAWRALSDAEKKPYVDAYEAEKKKNA